MSSALKIKNWASNEPKKLGLVWEQKTERVIEDCKKKLPVLKEVEKKAIITDKNQPTNLIIEGDNYHALSVLNYTHTEKIDLIYIDPPYNTGSRDWKYNNNFVDNSDPYKHSKWLSFMYERISISKRLLKEDGVICVTIDDYEMPRLWLIMEQVFGYNNHLGTVIIRNTPSGRKTKRKFALIHEYAIFFGKSNKSFIKKELIDISKKSHAYKKDTDGSLYCPTNLRKSGIDSEAIKKDGSFRNRYYPIYYNSITNKITTIKTKSYKNIITVYPIDNKNQKRIWRRGKEDIDLMFRSGELWGKKIKEKLEIFYKFRGGLDGQPPKSIWADSNLSASDYGSKELSEILNKRETFPYPKSKHAVIRCIKSATSKNSVILDFFAGSGTTGHAVLEINKEDGGNRQFILCTNNENNICEEVTYPRIKNVIRGYRYKGTEKKTLLEEKINLNLFKKSEEFFKKIEECKLKHKEEYDSFKTEIENKQFKLIGVKKIKDKKEGLGGNLRYFKTDFIDSKGKATDSIKKKLIKNATEMLCIKENTFEKVKITKGYKIFKNNQIFMGIIFENLNETYLSEFKNEIKKVNKSSSVYVFSLFGEGRYESEFSNLKNIKVIPVPEAIMRVYNRIFFNR